MKKFISFAAYALLASALTCSLAACSSDDDEGDVLAGLPEVPETAEQAEAMLMGQWKRTSDINGFLDEHYWEFNKQKGIFEIVLPKADILDKVDPEFGWEWYYDYPKQYVALHHYETFTIKPNPSNPAEGKIIYETEGENEYGFNYSQLTKSSVKLDGLSYIRSPKNVSYTVVTDI